MGIHCQADVSNEKCGLYGRIKSILESDGWRKRKRRSYLSTMKTNTKLPRPFRVPPAMDTSDMAAVEPAQS